MNKAIEKVVYSKNKLLFIGFVLSQYYCIVQIR